MMVDRDSAQPGAFSQTFSHERKGKKDLPLLSQLLPEPTPRILVCGLVRSRGSTILARPPMVYLINALVSFDACFEDRNIKIVLTRGGDLTVVLMDG